ncbi:MAG: prepilin-type N-terminal cleavage/methylation domain-containing protein [Candidatus Sumerlaeia bacterium]|nr:prepilin-type N-terminal cleavage/methylation domain-containing protein [Candidatus Sumerlaeia bacterium]
MNIISAGFTLIELLIVVAIIAILAAIGVPNFLEAQVRAKVTRAKADMRSIATGIESYRVDNNRYPLPDNVDGSDMVSPRPTFFETKLPRRLTTPIAYITLVPNEPFPNLAENSETYFAYHYATREYSRVAEEAADGADSLSGEQEFDAFFLATMGSLNRASAWYLLSHGPDSDHDAGAEQRNGAGTSGAHLGRRRCVVRSDQRNGVERRSGVVGVRDRVRPLTHATTPLPARRLRRRAGRGGVAPKAG